jgi:hypothetical protein
MFLYMEGNSMAIPSSPDYNVASPPKFNVNDDHPSLVENQPISHSEDEKAGMPVSVVDEEPTPEELEALALLQESEGELANAKTEKETAKTEKINCKNRKDICQK